MKAINLRRAIISTGILFVLYPAIGFVFQKGLFTSMYEWKFKRAEEDRKIKATVALYNKILTDLYVSDGVPTMLNDFPASKQLRHELFRNLGHLREEKLVIIYDMADLIFKEIKRPSPTTAEAIVYEEWNYIYRKLPSREIARSIKGMGGGFGYKLIKKKEGWVIMDYAPADVKVEKKDEFVF